MTEPQSRRGSKSRIVIDVARVQAEARAAKGRRFGRFGRYVSVTGLVVAGLVLVLLVSCYAWWQSYKKSPPYSLALLVDAAQRDDMPTVESLIDADSIAQGFIPQVIDKLAGADSPLPAQARGALTAALPQLLPRVRETMRDEIARDLKGFSKNETSRMPFFLKALRISQMSSVEQKGETAVMNFGANDRPVQFTMRRDGERWKVVTVKDEQLATDISARLASSLPAAQPAQPQVQTRRKGAR